MLRSLRFTAVIVLACACGEPLGSPPGPEAPGSVSDRDVEVGPTGPRVANQLIVVPAPGASDSELAGAIADLGLRVVWRAPYSGAYLVAGEGSVPSLRRELEALDIVLEATPNHVASGAGVGTTPSIDMQWYLPASGLNTSTDWGSAIGIRLALLDTGVAYETTPDGSYVQAPSLAGVPIVAPYDFVSDDAHPNDDHGHGTHLASVIAGSGELLPVAPGVELIPVKVLDSEMLGTELALVEGLYHAAESGADIINLSLAFEPGYFPSRLLQGAIEDVSRSGAVVVAAAGNHGVDTTSYPAAFRDVVAVGASTIGTGFDSRSSNPWFGDRKSVELASYSGRGSLIDIVAPGGHLEIDQDGDGEPDAVLAESFISDPTQIEYLYSAGTSPAVAIVSGIASIARSSARDLAPDDFRSFLGETARRETSDMSVMGQGYLSARHVLNRAQSQRARALSFASVDVRLEETGDGTVARAVVQVIDDRARVEQGRAVYASFTGGIHQHVYGETDKDGFVTFVSQPLEVEGLVALQVEAITDPAGGSIARPYGFARIDSCSLLAIIDASDIDDVGVATTFGQGVGTTPSDPWAFTLPGLAGADPVRLLVDFGGSRSTYPMAVAVDPAVYSAVETFSASLELLGAAGEPFAVSAEDDDLCVSLLVREEASGRGVGTTPSYPTLGVDSDLCESQSGCSELQDAIDVLWASAGLAEYDEALGVDADTYEHLAEVVSAYQQFSGSTGSVLSGSYGSYLEAAGVGVVTQDGAAPAGVGMRSRD